MKMIKEAWDISDIEIKEDVNLSRFTTIRLSASGTIVLVKTETALAQLICLFRKKSIPYHLVGWGANQVLISTQNTVFIKLAFELNAQELSKSKSEYYLPASVPLNILTSHASKFGLQGWEVFTGIPASLGGAIYMNAGTALGEIGSLIKSVSIMTIDGQIRTHIVNKDSFSYRENHFVKEGEVILSAIMIHKGLNTEIKEKIKEYLTFRKASQPLTTFNCGCVFKNYDQKHKAGQFIDICGLKGLSVNGLSVSHKHGNFIENQNNATSEDFSQLIDALKFELELHSGIEFELEAKVY